MKAFVASRSPCPIGRAARLLGDRWTLLILREAFLGVDRFDGFLERLAISRAALASRLGWLVKAGLLRRDPPAARRARYLLTPAGEDVRPVLEAMRVWGQAWLPHPDGTPAPW